MDFVTDVGARAKANQGNVFVLESGELEYPLRYLSKKMQTPFASVRSAELVSTINRGREGSKSILLVTPTEARQLIQEGQIQELVKTGKLEILVNDQIRNSITPFNFRNPEATARALSPTTGQDMADLRRQAETLGIGSDVRPVYYDGDLPNPRRLSFGTAPTGRLSLAQAEQRVGPRQVQGQDFAAAASSSSGAGDASLQVGVRSLHLETMQRTNERVGSLLTRAREYAARNGMGEDIYFYVGEPHKSPALFRRMLSDGYGIPEDRFITKADLNSRNIRLANGRTPMVLVVDDFAGSGKSMEEFFGDARNIRFSSANQTAVSPSIHAFAPFATESSAATIGSATRPAFVDTYLDRAAGTDTFQTLERKRGNMGRWGFSSNGTALGFEYTSPDNNVDAVLPLIRTFTPPVAVKQL